LIDRTEFGLPKLHRDFLVRPDNDSQKNGKTPPFPSKHSPAKPEPNSEVRNRTLFNGKPKATASSFATNGTLMKPSEPFGRNRI